MLRTIADILQGFIKEEKAKLDKFEIKHGPTIGRMYEGLTQETLNRAIPQEIGLSIESGVIYNDAGEMTGEIDCMLVQGKGIEIPYTSNYKWHVKDVICVFEIKKKLYSSDLADSFSHLRGVLSNYRGYVENSNSKELIDISSARKAFKMMTRKVAPEYKNIESLPLMEQIIFHTLVMEQLSPIRIVLGYTGYKSEYSFREAMVKFLENNLYMPGFGVSSFPQLIISENYSLIKANGQPYSPPIRNGYWDFYGSSSENPIIFVLELIWTRLNLKYNLGGLWGEDLDVELIHAFLKGKLVLQKDLPFWEFQYIPISKAILEEGKGKSLKWEPSYLDINQYVIISRLCLEGQRDISDLDFILWLEQQKINTHEFIESLLQTGLVAKDGNFLRLTTELCQCAILPTGEYIAAENNTGQLTKWMANFLSSKKQSDTESN